jgi:hypothetical protein
MTLEAKRCRQRAVAVPIVAIACFVAVCLGQQCMAATPSPVSAVHAHAEQIVTLRHADGFTVRAKMSKSALLRGDDPLTLTTFQDLTEQLWTEGS